MKNFFKKITATTLSILLIGLIVSAWESGSFSDSLKDDITNRPVYGLFNDAPPRDIADN
ncbi:MAG: hypothetical protein HDR02_05660 [Lachnospiraceae bacterium]|nr:hypothetical protein [Lachnospiraceae bacterium]